MTMMATRVNTSPKIVTTPEEKSSFSVSTSEVTRVISRPTGFRSKKEMLSRWRCSKICIRRSYMTRWPIQVVSRAPPVLHDELEEQHAQVERGEQPEQRDVAPWGSPHPAPAR